MNKVNYVKMIKNKEEQQKKIKMKKTKEEQLNFIGVADRDEI